MGDTSSLLRQRPVWSVTRRKSPRYLRLRRSAVGMIRAQPAIKRTHFPLRVRSGATLVTSRRRSWRRTRPLSTATAAVVTNPMRCERPATELAKAATRTCPRPIKRKTKATVPGATTRIRSAWRRSPINARSATKKPARSARFTRARFRVRPAISLTGLT